MVKRVVGIPGDVVQMRNNALIINNETLQYQSLNESGIYTDLNEDLLGVRHAVRVRKNGSRTSSFTPLLIPPGFYMALGDNRDNSADSRVIGQEPKLLAVPGRW